MRRADPNVQQVVDYRKSFRIAPRGIEWAAQEIFRFLENRKPKIFLISDEQVALLYLHPFVKALNGLGFDPVVETFPPGEVRKNLDVASRLLDTLALHQFARDDLIVAMGGGVVTDIGGFAAAVYSRGIDWIAVPTSLLGMVDASIGGKTGVNHPLGKNLIGAFHAPALIAAPFNVLETLAARNWRSGSAEAIKAALLSGGDLWKSIAGNGPDLKQWNREAAYDAVLRAARAKIDIVERDFRESGVRRLLNLGHTFGHALETVTEYSCYDHGEAVLLGLRAAARMSRDMKLLPERQYEEIDGVLEQAVYPSAEIDPAALLDATQQDKKVRRKTRHWVLLKAPGKPVITADVEDGIIQATAEWLADLAKQGRPPEQSLRRKRLLILNGPNLNLLGEREPEHYGSRSYAELEKFLKQCAADAGADCLIRQSNDEGELVSMIQWARRWASGIIINPGGYAHTSVAIRDALAASPLPAVEVHLTDIAAREDFRKTSLTAAACRSMFSGKGFDSYREAIEILTTKWVIEQEKSFSL